MLSFKNGVSIAAFQTGHNICQGILFVPLGLGDIFNSQIQLHKRTDHYRSNDNEDCTQCPVQPVSTPGIGNQRDHQHTQQCPCAIPDHVSDPKKIPFPQQKYGEDIGITVEDWYREDVAEAVREANAQEDVHGIIVQLPLVDPSLTDEVVSEIAAEKDVDGLGTEARIQRGETAKFESATATAINWLLAGYDINLAQSKITLVGRGRLIGKPLARMWGDSGYDVTAFGRGSDLMTLRDFDVIVSATGVPHLIKTEMIKPGAIIVDAGTASEGGVLVGDLDESVRERQDLAAITLKVGGVGPLTVAALFEHVLMVASKTH